MEAYSNKSATVWALLGAAFTVTNQGNWFSFLILLVGKPRAREEKTFSRPQSQLDTEFQFLPSSPVFCFLCLVNGTPRLIALSVHWTLPHRILNCIQKAAPPLPACELHGP